MVEFWVKTFGGDDFEAGVNDVLFDEQEPKKWQKHAYRALKDALKNKEYIELKMHHYPLGREYGNKYWKIVGFEYAGKDKWEMHTTRGSDRYAVWHDVGMTGVVEDDGIYVDESDVEALFREFIEDPQHFDLADQYFEGSPDVSVEDLWGIEEFCKAEGDDWDFILEIRDDEHVNHYLCKDVALDDETREAVLELVIERREWDIECLDDEEEKKIRDNIEKVKEALQRAKTIREFLEWAEWGAH